MSQVLGSVQCQNSRKAVKKNIEKGNLTLCHYFLMNNINIPKNEDVLITFNNPGILKIQHGVKFKIMINILSQFLSLLIL